MRIHNHDFETWSCKVAFSAERSHIASRGLVYALYARLCDRRGEVSTVHGSDSAGERLGFANFGFIAVNIIQKLRENGRVSDGKLDGFTAGRANAASETTNSGCQCPGTAYGIIVQRLSFNSAARLTESYRFLRIFTENDGKMFQKVHRQARHLVGQLGTGNFSPVPNLILKSHDRNVRAK